MATAASFAVCLAGGRSEGKVACPSSPSSAAACCHACMASCRLSRGRQVPSQKGRSVQEWIGRGRGRFCMPNAKQRQMSGKMQKVQRKMPVRKAGYACLTTGLFSFSSSPPARSVCLFLLPQMRMPALIISWEGGRRRERKEFGGHCLRGTGGKMQVKCLPVPVKKKLSWEGRGGCGVGRSCGVCVVGVPLPACQVRVGQGFSQAPRHACLPACFEFGRKPFGGMCICRKAHAEEKVLVAPRF